MDNNRESNIISLKGKNKEEILKKYEEISTDTLLLHELLKKYDDKTKALNEYQKIKSKINNDLKNNYK